MKTILILHGWGSRAENWSQVKKLLEDYGYRVLIPDLPGFGKNPPPLQAWNIDDYVEWVENYCEENNLSQFYLLGHSFGGATATKFVLKNPEMVEKLFLLASSGIRKKSIKKTLFKKIAKFFKKFAFLPFFHFFRKVFYKFIIKSDYIYTQEGSVMRETYLNVINEDISKDFSKISIPTIIIWGERDSVTPIQHAYFIKEQIPGAKLEVLPKIDHNLNKENPKLLIEKILSNL